MYHVITTWRCGFELVKEQNLTTNLSYHIHIAMFGKEIIVTCPRIHKDIQIAQNLTNNQLTQNILNNKQPINI